MVDNYIDLLGVIAPTPAADTASPPTNLYTNNKMRITNKNKLKDVTTLDQRVNYLARKSTQGCT